MLEGHAYLASLGTCAKDVQFYCPYRIYPAIPYVLFFFNLEHCVTEGLSEEEKLAALMSNNNDYFLAVMGIIIIFMQAGFAFLEAGSIRAKNTTNILIKNYADLCIGAILFWLIGYSFAFGAHNPFIGFDYFMLVNLPKSDYTFFFFQVSTYG